MGRLHEQGYTLKSYPVEFLTTYSIMGAIFLYECVPVLFLPMHETHGQTQAHIAANGFPLFHRSTGGAPRNSNVNKGREQTSKLVNVEVDKHYLKPLEMWLEII